MKENNNDSTATRIIIASKNPVKVAVVQDAFKKVFCSKTNSSLVERFALFIHQAIKQFFKPHQYFFTGINAPSGVSDQPATYAETKQGALNRLAYCEKEFPNADFWAALEGGVVIEEGEVYEIGYIAIKQWGNDRIAWAEIGRFPIPHKVADLVRKGEELGPASDKVFGLTNSKQQGGMPGIITKVFGISLLTRYDIYLHACIFAFAQLWNSDMYE